MKTPKIEWYERPPNHPAPGYDAMISGMRIASVVVNPHQATGWWIHIFLAPLPPHLQDLIPLNPSSKAEAVRVVEQILAGYITAINEATEKETAGAPH